MKKNIIAVCVFLLGFSYVGYEGYSQFKPAPRIPDGTMQSAQYLSAITQSISMVAHQNLASLKTGDINSVLMQKGRFPDAMAKDGFLLSPSGDPIKFTYDGNIDGIRANYTVSNSAECISAVQYSMMIPGYMKYLSSTGIKDIRNAMVAAQEICASPGIKTLNIVWPLSSFEN